MKQMQNIRSLCLFVALCAFANVRAQLSTNEKPVSFGRESEMQVKHRSTNPIVTMPQLDMAKIEKEDKEDEEYDMPPRFGYPHMVNYNLNNSGTWYELSNGDKLWQLNVICPNALSVNFCYDKFWIPEGGKLFVYSKDKKQSIGAFTSKNNKGDSLNVRGFASGLVFGDDVILEYYQPKEVRTEAIISIEYVIHGYRYIKFGEKGFGDSGDCMVNINCDEGQNWQNEKRAVARIIIQGRYYCSGSLITTTNLSGEPFFLTANHCISKVNKDALNDPSLDYTFFYWNYEAPGCSNVYTEPTSYTTSGATVLANNSSSDFALFRLDEDPQNLIDYIPYYLGWDRSGVSSDPGVCIHHPKGDVKKISTVADQPVSTSYLSYAESANATHWKITWGITQHNHHGTTEGGSSGSPLLSAKHKVIGQLHGGYSDCGDSIMAPDWYGKFNLSWTGNDNSSVYRRLNCWLDSLNTGIQTIEGLLIIPTPRTMTDDEQLYSNIRILGTGQLTIQGEIEQMGNSQVIVEPGGKLIIDGGTLSKVDLVLKPGSSLRIINGGIIETRNGFKAPVGALVNIENGKIF